MSFITIQIRGIHMTRRRNGEELSDPVSEVQDGDGESPEVVAHFDVSRHILPRDSMFELAPRQERKLTSGEPDIADVGAPSMGGHLAEPEQDDQDHHRGRGGSTERLRARIRARKDEGPKAWLEELARAAAEAAEPVELFAAHKIPGAWLRARVRAHGESVELRATVRPGAPGSARPMFARASGEAPGLVLEARGRLRPDGSLSEIEARAASEALAEPCAELEARLRGWTGARPARVAAELEGASRELPTAAVHFVRERLEEIESLELEAHPEGLRPAPTFGELVEDRPADHIRRITLEWTDEGEPVLRPASSAVSSRAIGRDLRRVERLMALLASGASQKHAA
jgi:hypothetical protein